ncbi:MAG: hypothetical protein IT341_10565 [Chloroflexi bacterium]|nr:hypothetical protein [Chloroflexota bacterium]
MTVEQTAEPNIVKVGDGEYAEVMPARPMPATLDLLLLHFTARTEYPFRLVGTLRECTDSTHVFSPWLDGRWGLYELRLNRCPFCGTVEVRDVSLDFIPGLSSSSLPLRRRDQLLCWYSGRRPAGRTYA